MSKADHYPPLGLVMTSGQAAHFLGVAPGVLARFLGKRDVRPLRRIRDGRSTVTLWAERDISRIARELYGESRGASVR